jgi:signal recognition particle subunit SRP19
MNSVVRAHICASNIFFIIAQNIEDRETLLKDYEHVVLWLDYFNKNLKRRQGRKVKRDQAIFDPTVQELVEASRAAGFHLSEQEVNSDARFPRRSFVKSGYVMVAKKEGIKKSQIIDAVANKLLQRSLQKSSKK